MEQHKHPITGYGTLIAVWLILLLLTAMLVGASFTWPSLAITAMLLFTPLKALLVVYFFMHLRYEGYPLKFMVSVALAALIIFIGLTFLDVAFR